MNRLQARRWTTHFAICAAVVGLSAVRSSASIITVGNPSFETPPAAFVGPATSGNAWGSINSPWVASAGSSATAPGPNDSFYQQNNIADTASFTTTAHGSWFALICNPNTGSITQNLSTTVTAGQTLSVTFFGGRGKTGSSVAAGGVFNATFLVNGTPYTSTINTTLNANNSWTSYTLTKTITNSGNLSLQFSSVSGFPWLDNISNVTVVPEPGTFAMLLCGAMVLLSTKKSRRGTRNG